MKLTAVLLLSLSLKSSLGSSISYSEFNEILSRECTSELQSLSAGDAEDIWKAATDSTWNNIFFSRGTQSFPFLFLSRKPGSGYSRGIDLKKNVFEQTDNVMSELGVVYNGMEFTVFSAQAQKSTAQDIRDIIVSDISGDYSIQPVLPMCKLNNGLKTSAETRFSSGKDAATVLVKFGGEMGSTLAPTSGESFLSDISNYDVGDTNDLSTVYPVSWSSILDGITFSSSVPVNQLESSFSDDSVRVSLSRANGIFNDKEILSFVSGLAVRGDVEYIELLQDITISPPIGFNPGGNVVVVDVEEEEQEEGVFDIETPMVPDIMIEEEEEVDVVVDEEFDIGVESGNLADEDEEFDEVTINDIPIPIPNGVPFSVYSQVFDRECVSELGSLSDRKLIEDVWTRSTFEAWRVLEESPYTQSFSFLFLSTKSGSTSSYFRLLDVMLNVISKTNGYAAELEVIDDTDESTLFSVLLRRDTAQQIRDIVMGDPSGDYAMQPLLPMCKLSSGLKNFAMTTFSSGTKPAIVDVQFANALGSGLVPGDKESFVKELSKYNIGKSDDIRAVFPLSWSVILESVSTVPPAPLGLDEVSSFLDQDNVRVVIDRENGDFNHGELLSFISGLAMRGNVEYVELLDELPDELSFFNFGKDEFDFEASKPEFVTTEDAIGISFHEFSTILDRECVDELNILSNTEEKEGIWENSTAELWQVMKDSPYTQSFPFLFSTKKSGSGYFRLLDFLLNVISKSNGYATELEVVTNTDEQTVFSTHVRRDTAQEIRDIIMSDSSGDYAMQPLLPMCKLSSGLKSFAESTYNEGTTSTATVVVEFGDALGSILMPGDKASFMSEISKYSIGSPEDIITVFPVSGNSIVEGSFIVDTPLTLEDASSLRERNKVEIEINREDGNFNYEELLSFVSGLAVMSDVKYVELPPDVSLFGFGF